MPKYPTFLIKILKSVDKEGKKLKKLQEFKKMLTEMDKKIETVNLELEKLPKGVLCAEKRRGGIAQVHSYTENGKRIRTTITKDKGMQARLVKYELLSEEIKYLEHNRKLLASLIDRYKPFGFNQTMRAIETRGQCDGRELLRLYSRLYDEQSAWAREYTPPNYYSEERKHLAANGLHVRSKSEVLIVDKLIEHGIAFRYEQPLEISGALYYPDFTIMRSDGKMFYWEHAGQTNSQRYLDRFLNKVRSYATVNIVPWDNLIITYDNAEGNIDLRIVESEIVNKLLL